VFVLQTRGNLFCYWLFVPKGRPRRYLLFVPKGHLRRYWLMGLSTKYAYTALKDLRNNYLIILKSDPMKTRLLILLPFAIMVIASCGNSQCEHVANEGHSCSKSCSAKADKKSGKFDFAMSRHIRLKVK